MLGLDRSATKADVRAAYLRLAKKHHPDKNPGEKASAWIFKEIQTAYETLCGAEYIQPAGQQQPPRAQENRARTQRERQSPPPGDRAEHDQQEGAKPTCRCGSVFRWWTRLPRIVRLIGAWVKWALLVVAGTWIYGFFLSLAVSALAWLLHFLGVPLPSASGSVEGAVTVTFGLGFGLALWVTERPKECPQCGRVSSGWS